ncbi:MAG: hypothetical protein Q7R52_03550 [archaeon]|nr:hypothetical protein [archaeon]
MPENKTDNKSVSLNFQEPYFKELLQESEKRQISISSYLKLLIYEGRVVKSA